MWGEEFSFMCATLREAPWSARAKHRFERSDCALPAVKSGWNKRHGMSLLVVGNLLKVSFRDVPPFKAVLRTALQGASRKLVA
jgi:hypothetical protein